MKTNKLFFIASLLILTGINKGISQNYTAPAASTGGSNNTFVGINSGLNNTSSSNSGFGSSALINATGGYNSSFGAWSMVSNTSGTLNAAVGTRSLESNTLGSGNVGFGHRALGLNTTGNNNTALGYGTLIQNNNSLNIAVGYFTPRNFTTGGDNNIFIGNETAVNLNSGNNNTLIGKIIFNNVPSTTTQAGNDTDRTIILADGNGSQRFFISKDGFAGIGLGNNMIPQNTLEIKASGLSPTQAGFAKSGLRLKSLLNTSFNPTPPTSDRRVLSVNANGDVILVDDAMGQTFFSNTSTATVTGSGTALSPFQINSCNLYSCDGTIDASTTTNSNRTVRMGKSNIVFSTDDQKYGKIYIGKNPNFPIVNANYKLYVEDGILTEKVRVALRASTDWQDHIFGDGHVLMPLKEVESFVKNNKHLPGIESAEELVNKGLDLGAMQSKQMGKIEELTLYVIEQNKALEKQNKEIEELKAQVKMLLERK
jgi:hypothetical protein